MSVLNKSTQLLLLCGAAAALPNQALAVSFSTSSGYTFSGTGAIQATGQGVQQISTSFNKSVSLGGLSLQCDPTNITGACGYYGAEASVSTSGGLFLNVDASFSGSQASLSYNGKSATTVTQLGAGRYSISLNAAPVAQSFSDTGAIAAFKIDGGLALKAAARGRLCTFNCASGSATILDKDIKFNLLGASNDNKGSITVLGQQLPLVTLDKQQSLSFAGQGAPYLKFTLNSVGATATGTTSASTTNSVFSADLDLIRMATTTHNLPSSASANLGSIGSVAYNIGSGGATVGVSLTRNDKADLSFSQVVSFVDRQTGQPIAVPIAYTTKSYTFNPDGRFGGANDRATRCTNLYSASQSVSVTFLTGGDGSITRPGPAGCFTFSSTDFTKSMTSVTGTSTSVAFQVGDGSFDFGKVKVVSKTDIGGKVSSQRTLGVSGGAYLTIGSGKVDISGLGGGGFGPLVSTDALFPLASKDLGTQTVTFANTTVQNAIGFDGATSRPATVGLTGSGTALVQGVTMPALALGNVRVGQIASGVLTIANTAANDGFSEALLVSAAVANGAARTANAPSGAIAPGGSATLAVSIDTSRAGAKSGTVAFSANSDGSQTNAGQAVALGTQTAAVSADVYAPAVASVTPVVNFGTVRVGDATSRSIGVTNSASDALTDTLVTTVGAAPAGFKLGTAPGALAQGQAGSISVGLDTSLAGSFSAQASLGFASRNPTLADLTLASQTVRLTGTVNNHAVATFLKDGVVLTYDAARGGFVYDFGEVAAGQALSLTGFALENHVTGPADILSGSIATGSPASVLLASPVTVSGLGAGGVSSSFGFSLDTSHAGAFTGQLLFTGWGTNASDPIGEARQATLFLTGAVAAVPEPSRAWLFALGAACLAVFRRRRNAAA